ncbi:MAG: winged helix-turn-helix transcriptional regulator [Candidatus Bathycorpusculaceae bacterium]
MSTLDKIDEKIIEMLRENGRKSFTAMAKKLNLNEATVRKRVSNLQKNGVIKRFTIEVDPSKVGMKTVAIVGIHVDPTRLLEAAQSLCEFKETKCVATSTGDHMIMTEIWARNGKELTEIISEKIGAIEGVERICPAIILEKLKD